MTEKPWIPKVGEEYWTIQTGNKCHALLMLRNDLEDERYYVRSAAGEIYQSEAEATYIADQANRNAE